MRDHIRRRLSEVLGNLIPEKLRGFEEERLLFYFLLNAARERLYLLYERSDEAGKPKVQSHYLMDILQKVKNISTTRNDFQIIVFTYRVGLKINFLGKKFPCLLPRKQGFGWHSIK